MAAYGFSNALVPGRFNIWIPGRANSAYLSFDTAAEAQNDARAHQMGVIVNPQGQVDPALQTWTGWTQYQSSVPGAQPVVLNPQAAQAAPAATARPGAAPVIPTTNTPPTPAATPVNGQYAVYVPAQWLSTVGANNSTGAFNGGAFVSFGTLAEAQAYAQSKNVGVILDTKGAIDPGQVWNQAASYATLSQNYRLAASPAANKFNVWFPQAVMGSTQAPNAASFGATGAFLSFDTQAEAAAFVQRRGFGGVLTPKGTLDPTQPWPSIRQYMGQLPSLQAQLQPQAVAGKYNVWFPQNYLNQVGVTNTQVYTHGVFVPFDSQADAQAFVRSGNLGVMVNPQGDMDSPQIWAYGNQFGVQLSNGRLATKPTPNEFNVWFPAGNVNQLGLANAQQFQVGGAYLSFKTEAEAQAHARARSMGVILDQAGKPAATQTWNYAQGYIVQLENARLQPKPAANEFNVWFPQNYLGNLGVQNPQGFTNGAYLSFKTEAEAQAHMRARGFGVILDQAGKPAATQVWNQANGFIAQMENARLTAQRTPNAFNVWFPLQYVGSLGVSNPQQFTAGAYLSFATEAEAQAHVRARGGWGVILDGNGTPAATQLWNQAGNFGAQLLNAQLKPAPVKNEFNVWFPANVINSLGVVNNGQFPTGAYLGFKTEAEAQAHARLRNFGVLLDDKGKLAATQIWNQANAYGVQLLNNELTPTRKAGKFAVWFPQNFIGNLGPTSVTGFTSGAYLAFDTLAEAQTHARARGMGIVLDDKGNYDPTAQTWQQAGAMHAMMFNADLKTAPKHGEFNVWFPTNVLGNLGLGTNQAQFAQTGAYLAFKTEAEAQAHVRERGNFGVVLDDKGKVAATQPWAQAQAQAALLLNDQLTLTRTPNKFSVWFPQQYVQSLGQTKVTGFTHGAYLAFDSLAEAQQHARARNFGVVLDAQGNYDQTAQTWPQAAQLQAQLLNSTATAQRTPGKYAVWFPQQYAANAGLNPQSFNGGAFIAFNSQTEAQAHARARGNLGVVLDANGALDGTQPWPFALQFVPQLTNHQLTPQRAGGQYAVWFPQGYLGNIGVQTPQNFPGGAFLSFATAAEAQAHVKARGNIGVILDGNGAIDATQLMNNAAQFGAQLLNVQLKDKQVPGKYAVWFPMNVLGNIGVSTPQSFPGGAYLAFNTLAEAQAHAAQRGNLGVLVDPDGSLDATQVWAQSGTYVAQRLNSQIQPQLTAGKWNVWFPANLFGNIGFAGGPNFQGGGYLAFNSKQEALEHVKQRTNQGVIVDDQGRTAAVQLWPQALQLAAANTNIKPPPPSGWVDGPAPADPSVAQRLGTPTAGSVAITDIQPTKTGADITAYVASVRPPDAFHFFIGGQINGSWMAIFSVPDLINVAATGWNKFTLHVDYAAIEAYLKGVNPALGVQPDMASAVGIKFVSGHDTGIPGWSQNQGTERDALTKLPAKSP